MAQLVTITIDGVKYSVPPGTVHFKELVSATGLNAKTNKITVVSAAPSQASAIGGNDSYNIIGGEVFTSTHS